MKSNPLAIIADVAARYVGLRETSRNRAPEISQFWDFTNYKQGDENREPWCCAAVSAWVQMADAESELINLRIPPRTGAVAEFLEWAKNPANNCITFGPKHPTYRARKGDIVIYLPNLSHIGVVASDYLGDGFMQLIEGNTNLDGSREGDGVYRKQRRYSFAGTFVRLPHSPVK